jgi:hypothetical protein
VFVQFDFVVDISVADFIFSLGSFSMRAGSGQLPHLVFSPRGIFIWRFPGLDFWPRGFCRSVDPQVPLGLWSFVLVHDLRQPALISVPTWSP